MLITMKIMQLLREFHGSFCQSGNGHSLKMLQRIATSLGKNLTVRIEDRPKATLKKRAAG